MAFTSTVAGNYEAITYRAPGMSLARGQAQEIIECTAATTLTMAQSGALVLMDAAAGFVITLPKPSLANIGAQFEFLQTVTQTSGSQKIITDAATTFLLGEVFTFTTATASGAGFAFDGSTHVSYLSNGTTSGGIIGTSLKVTCLSATVWRITGMVVGSGTIVTPASTT